MRGRREERIEAAVDRGAAALLAVALGFALFFLLPRGFAQPGRIIVSAVSALAGYRLTWRVLRSVAPRPPRFEVPHFPLPELPMDAGGELLLTDAHRLQRTIVQLAGELVLTDADLLYPARAATDELMLTDADRLDPTLPDSDELVLDDILTELAPDSRVVRLFDPAAMPTPGQLNRRIEQHLGGTAPPAAPAPTDASQALYEALSELRRSLR